LLVLSFLGLIAVGTALLELPWASAQGVRLPFMDALFTSTSAVCVTGLIVLDTPAAFSPLGQVVILLLIQAGGLGYMTLSTLLAAALGRRVTLQERMTLKEGLNAHAPGEILRFARGVFAFTLLFECLGTLVLALRWWPEFGLARGTWLSIFHAVSAFNNAGFSLFTDNLMGHAGDAVVMLTVSGLVVVGGLGFFTITELAGVRRSRVPLSMHTRLVLASTVILLAGGTLAVYGLERGNPATLGGMSAGTAWLSAWFQSAVPRTAGFNSIAIGACTAPTLFVMMVLMFIGAAPGGTGGGVKVSTFAVTVAALWTTVRGDVDAVLFRRRIPPETVARAFFICLIAFLAVNVVAGLLLVTERRDLLPTLFESVSAFATVGLSTGEGASPLSLAGHMSRAGQLLLIGLMFAGRIGPLTLAFALAQRHTRSRVRHPEGKVLIG
jgi:trk system potassium uptake protein TrkH